MNMGYYFCFTIFTVHITWKIYIGYITYVENIIYVLLAFLKIKGGMGYSISAIPM
jgi:hypothetical protein